MWIGLRYNMCPYHHEHPSRLPTHPNPLGCPRALTLDALLHALNSHWSSVLHMVIIHVWTRLLFIWLWAGDLCFSRIMSKSTSMKLWLSHFHCSNSFSHLDLLHTLIFSPLSSLFPHCIDYWIDTVCFTQEILRMHSVQCRNTLLPDLSAEPNT